MLKTKTSCKDCCFLSENKCLLGRHEQFQKNNGIVKEENGFPVIENRFCAAFRTKDWAEKNDDKEVAVRNEILIRTHVYIYTVDWDCQKILKTVKSLNGQLLKPGGITFIGTKENFNNKVIPRLSKHGNIVTCLDLGYDAYKCLDMAISSCQSYFLLLITAGSKLPKDFLANIDEKINNNLEQFVAIEGNEEIIFGSSIDIYNKYLGSTDCVFVEEDKEKNFISVPIINKIKYFAHQHNEHSYIKTVKEFV